MTEDAFLVIIPPPRDLQEFLMRTWPDGDHEPPPIGQLLEERLGDLGRSCCHQDHIVRRVSTPALPTITVTEAHNV